MRMQAEEKFAVLLLLCVSVGAQCPEQSSCRETDSQQSLLDCIQLCKPDVPEKVDLSYLKIPTEAGKHAEEGALGLLLATITSMSEARPKDRREMESESSRDDRRSYPMEHFRWGKPVGRKRRPVKVFPGGTEEEDTTEVRRQLPDYTLQQEEEEAEEVEEEQEEEERRRLGQQKKDGTYKMHHFRWGGPPTNKRYGGFMKAWGGHSQKPLVTLFKNIMVKDDQQKKSGVNG